MLITASAVASTATVFLIFSFTDNLGLVNEEYKTSFPNVPSWVFQVEGNDSVTGDFIQAKYHWSRAPTSPNEFSFVAVQPGRITDYNEVSPILLSLHEDLGYNNYPRPPMNPPTTNTENFKPGEVRKWIIRKD